MEKIVILWNGGMNGSALYSILNSKGQKIITNKPIDIIVLEIIRIYPQIAEEILMRSDSYDYDMESINLSKVQPSVREEIVRLLKKAKEVSSK
jgi:hypothetical protein